MQSARLVPEDYDPDPSVRKNEGPTSARAVPPRSAQQRAADGARATRRRAGTVKEARILTSHEAAQPQLMESCARAHRKVRRPRQPTRQRSTYHCSGVLTHHPRAAEPRLARCIEMRRLRACMCVQACCSLAWRAPAASRCDYGSRRSSGAAEEARRT